MKNLFSNPVRFLLCNLLMFLASAQIVHAQNNNMGIGTTTPNASAILDITSNAKGLLIPRLTDGQQGGLSGPAGLLIYNTDQNRFNYYHGGWKGLNLWRANGLKAYYNDGNVGIGTTDPLSKLSISPNTTEAKITLWDGGSGTNHYGFGVSGGQLNYHVSGSTDSHVFYAGGKNGNGTELMRIYGNGSTRIVGSSYINNDNPTIYLQDVDGRSGMIHQNSDLMYFLSGSGVNSTTWVQNGGYWPLTLNMNTDAATFGGPAYFMEGNVGIGTTSPGQKLHVAGGIYAAGTITAGNEVNATGNITTSQNLYATSGTVFTNHMESNSVDIGSSGNAAAGYFTNNSQNEATIILENTYGPYNPAIWVWKGSLTLNDGDATKPGGGMWNFPSDRRLKKDIEDFQDGLNSLRKIRPVWYHYNGKNGLPTDRRYIGIIAQELEEVAPYMVSVSRSGENVGKYLTVDPNAFLYMLINSVQELDKTVQKQQQTIEAQQTEIEAIKKALTKAGIQLD